MALWTEPMQKDSSDAKGGREPDGAANNNSESVFAPGLTIEGRIAGAGNVRIAGRFKGDIDVKGDLSVERGARINGKINAQTVTIEGELEGNVVASAQVKLLESGQVIGEIKARTLTVAAGSRMRGNVDFGWEDSAAPAKRDTAMEKRPKEAAKPAVEAAQKPSGPTQA